MSKLTVPFRNFPKAPKNYTATNTRANEINWTVIRLHISVSQPVGRVPLLGCIRLAGLDVTFKQCSINIKTCIIVKTHLLEDIFEALR